jgi:hypothetical protein
MSDAKQIKALLRERIAELARYLFPNGQREGNHWCVGDISGAPGKSFKVCIGGENVALWGDFADSTKHSRNPLDLWMLARNVDFRTALSEAAEWCGQTFNGANGAEIRPSSSQAPLLPANASKLPFDWQKCVGAFTEKDSEQLAKERGYSIETCSWLKQNGLIGLYNGHIAFPVHDEAGAVVGAHYQPRRGGDWFYTPGIKVRPLLLGKLIAGDPVHCFESYWDAFDLMDKSGEGSGIIITRGASNGALVSSLVPETSTVYVWTQNDPAGQKWQRDICANTKAPVKCAQIPAPHKDLNDWTRAGATAEDLVAVLSNAEPIRQAKKMAVIGRAEAQVMRLSAIYALLDKSRVIRPEHHEAAMALWRYCEQSARWIFGTSTGDRNADKILTALRHASNGMTKTEISGDVFNRHASSIEIDEALRLLHGVKMVSYKMESTTGAPTQRWFSAAKNREISE